jgi:DNA-binding transcriptional regulator YiaG
MPNLASALKEEIRRLSRKEIKALVGSTKQAVAQYRREIAALKRQLADQQKQIKRLAAGRVQSAVAQDANENGTTETIRFSPKSVKAQRDRLGLSAKDYGKLVGVSLLSIYNWEQGKSRPQKAQRAALAAVRGIGKREAMAKLASMNGRP